MKEGKGRMRRREEMEGGKEREKEERRGRHGREKKNERIEEEWQ